MSRLAITTALLSLAAISAPALAQSPALAPYAAVFNSDQGLSVVIAPTADGKGALLRFKGVNHPVDGVVFLTDKVTEGKRISLRTQIDGRSWTPVISEDLQSWGGSYRNTQAYLPSTRDGIRLYYNDKESKALNLADLGKTYQKQKSEGVQEKLARFDKNQFVARTEARLKQADDDASKACGTPIKTSINWNSIKEDQMLRLGIGSYCATATDAVRQMCTDDAGFKAKAAQHAAITCQFGDKLNLSNSGGKLVFTTSESAANQDDFARQYLRNQ